MQKAEFDDKVHQEQVAELHSRIETAAATIISLESKVRDLSKTDVSVSEMLKQVRDTAETELRKFQWESDEQYNRNVSEFRNLNVFGCMSVQCMCFFGVLFNSGSNCEWSVQGFFSISVVSCVCVYGCLCVCVFNLV
jgi:hypothetical protein